jgi:hypothetical protein
VGNRPRSLVISRQIPGKWDSGNKMPKTAPRRGAMRAPRVRLAGTILLLVRLESGRQQIGKLHQLSITGGLVHLEKPLDEGIKVEVMFHVGSNTVRTKARMLFPMWATQGYLQPFEFDTLAQDTRTQLDSTLQNLLKQSSASLLSEESKSPEDIANSAPSL